MKEFKGRVAVITGAASGIGRAIAERCAREGMQVVLAGINLENLQEVAQALRGRGATVMCAQTDVSRRADVEALAEKTLQAFGGVHLLVNNAGVGSGSSPWQTSWEDWEWVLNVNLWGVINAVKVFTPIMLKQEAESCILNNASAAGLLSYHPDTPYMVSKHAVLALSENLQHWLDRYQARVRVSVLCSGAVESRILEARRNRPAGSGQVPAESDAVQTRALRELVRYMRQAIPAEQAADMVFEGLRQEHFVIFTHPSLEPAMQARLKALLKGQVPPEPDIL